MDAFEQVASIAADGVHLSPRLIATLTMLLRGDSEKQIAYKLGISKHTVHVYVKTLYRRFSANSRGELFAYVIHRSVGQHAMQFEDGRAKTWGVMEELRSARSVAGNGDEHGKPVEEPDVQGRSQPKPGRPARKRQRRRPGRLPVMKVIPMPVRKSIRISGRNRQKRSQHEPKKETKTATKTKPKPARVSKERAPTLDVTTRAIILQVESLGYIVKLFCVNDTAELHAVLRPGTEPPIVTRCNDGDGDDEAYRAACMLAEAVGINLEE